LGIPNFDQAARVLQVQLARTIEGYTFIEFETTVKGIGIAPGDLITITYLREGLERQPFRVVKLAPGANYQPVPVTAQVRGEAGYALGGTATIGQRRQPGAEIGLPRRLVGSIVDSHGIEQFGITETAEEATDGTFSVKLSCEFVPPARPAASRAAIP